MAAQSPRYEAYDQTSSRKRPGTMRRDSSGIPVPGEFNEKNQRMPAGDPNFGKGLSPDDEWARKFPTSATANRLAGRAAAPAPMMTGTVNKSGPSNITLPDTRPAGGARPGYSSGDVAKLTAAAPSAPMSLMTPWGPISRGPATAPATVAPRPAPQVEAAPPAITPANPATPVGPAIGGGQPTPAAAPMAATAAPASGPTAPWYDRMNKALTGNETLRENYTPRGAGRAVRTQVGRYNQFRQGVMGKIGQVQKAVTPTIPGTLGAIRSVGEGVRDFAEGAGVPMPSWMKRQGAKPATPVAAAKPNPSRMDVLVDRFRKSTKPTKRPEAQVVY